jgi:hypothetical protein
VPDEIDIDIDILTGPAAPVEHCGKPMAWRGSSTTWESKPGQGHEQTTTQWTCDCGAILTAGVSVPS